jgi:hypothetical protein
MELLADTLLVAGAFGAGFYCFVLSRRLSRFNDLEKGVGGAVAVLSAQVADLSNTLNAAKLASEGSNEELEDLTMRAEAAAQRLELMMASMHDLPEPPVASEPKIADRPKDANGPMFVRHQQSALEKAQ